MYNVTFEDIVDYEVNRRWLTVCAMKWIHFKRRYYYGIKRNISQLTCFRYKSGKFVKSIFISILILEIARNVSKYLSRNKKCIMKNINQCNEMYQERNYLACCLPPADAGCDMSSILVSWFRRFNDYHCLVLIECSPIGKTVWYFYD